MTERAEPCELSGAEKVFGAYFTGAPEFGAKLAGLLPLFSPADQGRIVSDIINTAIRYKNGGSPGFFELAGEGAARAAAERKAFMRRVLFTDGHYELNGYKLPVNFFLSDVFYNRLSVDRLDKTRFKDKDIIDAGACLGDSALILSDCGGRKVYAFEPDKENFKLLRETIRLNKREDIVPVRLGLGARPGLASMEKHACPGNLGGSRLKSGAGEVEINSLDDFAQQHKLDIGLIKIDVEGAERELLLGARRSLQRFRPSLILAVYHSPEDFFGLAPLLDSWKLGYRFKYAPLYAYDDFIVESAILAEAAD